MQRGLTKRARQAVVMAALAFGLVGMMGCSPAGVSALAESPRSAEISVYSREDGSGTRGAFVELFGLEEKNDSGNKIDTTTIEAAITNSTSVVMTSVAGDPNGIGYSSLGSLNDTVKALCIDGIAPTAENVKRGDYKAARSFNIVVTEEMTFAAQDFIDFIMSADGQAVVEDQGYIAVADNAPAYAPKSVSEKVVVAGSSSVGPVMEKLAEAYEACNPEASVEVQQSDSTTGVNMALDGTCDIGMASRELKESEVAAGARATAIAKDGIVIIVSPTSDVENLTSGQVKDIFSGVTTTWADVIG